MTPKRAAPAVITGGLTGFTFSHKAFMLVDDVPNLQHVLEPLLSSAGPRPTAGPHRIIKSALETGRQSQMVRSLSEKVVLTN